MVVASAGCKGSSTITPAVHPSNTSLNPVWLVMRGFELGQMPRMYSHLILLYRHLCFINLRPQLSSSTHKFWQVSVLHLERKGITIAWHLSFPLVIGRSSMASSSEPKSSKKRAGRKRLPALAPGPAIQFVVASHPDDFKDGDTMRNIRSHVMYKHRERGLSPSERQKRREGSSTPVAPTRTPSPMTSSSNGLLEDRNILTTSSASRSGTIGDQEYYNSLLEPHMSSPMRTLAAQIISATTSTPARSAPAISERASELLFAEHGALTQNSLASLKQEHINNTAFFCHGT
jgi:hypothetical protein